VSSDVESVHSGEGFGSHQLLGQALPDAELGVRRSLTYLEFGRKVEFALRKLAKSCPTIDITFLWHSRFYR